METIINFLDKDVKLVNTYRTYIVFENITQKSFEGISSTTELIMLFYATLVGSMAKAKQELLFTYDDFMNWLDDNPGVLTVFAEWFKKANTVSNELSSKVEEVVDEDAKKKEKPTQD